MRGLVTLVIILCMYSNARPQMTLKKNGFVTTVRKSKGADISAACGQLADTSILKSRIIKYEKS